MTLSFNKGVINLENEKWKDINFVDTDGTRYDYTGLYQVSNLGRVRSMNYNHSGETKIMDTKPAKGGYVRVMLYKNGKRKRFSIHRLVAHMFIPNENNLPIVNHRDENPSNNCVDNLEWCTQQYNVQYSLKPMSEEVKQKMSESKKGTKNIRARKVVCIDTKRIYNTMKEASDWCGSTHISSCCDGKRKTAGGYRWMYYEDYIADLKKQTDYKNISME